MLDPPSLAMTWPVMVLSSWYDPLCMVIDCFHSLHVRFTVPLPPDSHADQLTRQGQQLLEQDKLHQARSTLEQALDLWRQANHSVDALHTLRLLTLVAQRLHLPLLAKDYLQRALDLSRATHDRLQEAELLVDLGKQLADIGEIDHAITCYSQARQIYQELLNREAEGFTLFLIGKAYQQAGDMQTARPFFQQAFPLLRGTTSWTEAVAQMEQLLDTLAVADSVLGLLGGKGKRASLGEMGDNLRAQAATGSPTATRLFTAFSTMMDHTFGAVRAFGQEHRLQRNLTALADPDPKQRCAAARELAAYTPNEAIEPLFTVLHQDSDPAVQRAIVQTLCAYNDLALRERLRPLLQHPDADLRFAVALALDEHGEPAVEQELLEALKTQDDELRAQAVQVIEKRGNPAMAEALLPMLQDPSPKVRASAIYALGTLRDDRAVDGLIAATRDRYQKVRWAAVRVLGNLGDRCGVDAVIACLQDSNRDVRRSAATALGKLKDRRAVDALSLALTDDWWGVRESAQAALRKLKTAPSLPVLLAQLHHANGTTRRLAIEVLAVQQQDAAIPALRERLTDQNPWVRLAAIKALAAWKDLPSVPAMLAELRRDDPVIQAEVIAAVGKIGDSCAEPALIETLKHWNPYIRYASIQALSEIGTRESLPALAAIQLHDEGTVNLNQGWSFVSLKMVAAKAMQSIRTRQQLKGEGS